MQERITEIEIKLAHTEQALTELSDVLYQQQQLIDRMQQRMETLQHRVDASNAGSAGPDGADDKPPHY